MDVLALPEKSNMAVTESDPYPKGQGPKNIYNFLMPVRPLRLACDLRLRAEMLLILKKTIFDLITPRYFPI